MKDVDPEVDAAFIPVKTAVQILDLTGFQFLATFLREHREDEVLNGFVGQGFAVGNAFEVIVKTIAEGAVDFHVNVGHAGHVAHFVFVSGKPAQQVCHADITIAYGVDLVIKVVFFFHLLQVGMILALASGWSG